MQVSVGAIKISHAFHFELLVNVSMPSTNCQEPCREQIKWGPPLLFLLPPYRSTHSLTILSSHPEANNSWQAFPKMVPRPRNSCNAIQHSTYPPVVWALSPSRVAGGGGPASLCAGCAPSPSLWTCLNYVVRVSWFWCANFGNECYDLVATSETTKSSTSSGKRIQGNERRL